MKNLSFKESYNTSSGFTLMELLISITIMMTIMTIVGSAFKLGVKSIEKGENSIDTQRRYIFAVNYIYRTLEAVSLNENSIFEGTKEHIKFHAVLNTGLEEKCITQVMYSISKNGDDGVLNLDVSRKNAFPLKGEKNDEDIDTILFGIRDFSIQYLKNKNNGDVWIDEWKDKHNFPLAVKMKFTYSNKPAVIFVRNLRTKREFA